MLRSDILFTGFYGKKNTGDDAFIEVASWGAAEYWGKKNNRFLAQKSFLPKVVTPIKGYPLEVKRTYNFQASVLLNKTDAFIYAGGSTLHSKLSKNNIRLKAFEKKKAGYDIKFGGIGVSVGPFKSLKDEQAVQAYLKQMDFLAVRDQASFDFVSNINGLPYKPVNAFDLAALLPDIYDVKKEHIYRNERKTIGISVCQYESLQKDLDIKQEYKRNSMLIDLIKELDKKDNIHFKFFIINGHDKIGDLELTNETITKSCPKSYEVYSYNKETKQTWQEIGQCDFIISTRLHAAIFACFANTPFILNEYHRKCGDFLYNIGYNEKYRLYNSEYNITSTVNSILDIINDKSKYIEPLYVREMQEQAKLNFTSINI